MEKKGYSEILKKITDGFNKPDDPKYAILKYIVYVYAFSLPFIIILSYFSPCFLNLVIPSIAVLVPYKLFKEKSMKKIFVTGIIAILLLSLTFTAYQVETIYFSQEPKDLSSDLLSNGTVDKIYGEQKTKFNFTVDLKEEKIETDNYTVYLNITWMTTTTPTDGNDKSFTMNSFNNSDYYYIFNLKEHDMEDRLYSHYFSIRMNKTENVTDWQETDSSYGPFTISRLDAYQVIMLQQLISMSLFFILIIGMVWWRKRMTTSRKKSTEGLEEKEKELDDYCPECGALLEGKNTCPECCTEIESDVESKEDTEIFEPEEDIEDEDKDEKQS